MGRALLWLLPGLLAFLLAAALLAPPALLGRTLVLATVAVIPGTVVLVLVADARRRRGRGAPADEPAGPPTERPPDRLGAP